MSTFYTQFSRFIYPLVNLHIFKKWVMNKVKKYVLYISTVFFMILGSHLIYLYLYDGATSSAEKWGTISEAIIGWFPHLNPLIASTDHNSYINSLLYRSLLEYSTTSESFESDIVSCDLTDLLYIECTLENNLFWSDGRPITTGDIKSTFDIISKTWVNPIISSLLEDTTIEINESSISFSNTNKDINFLHIFLQPILPSSIVEWLNSENVDQKFSEINGIYSGRFILSNINQDETVGITKITLGKNEQYFANPLFVNFLILNLFRDESHFLKNKNSFNIFNDKENIIGESIPRLEAKKYNISQFVWVFFNSEVLSSEERKYISSGISREKVIESIGENKVLPVYNPFLSERNIDWGNSDYDIASAMDLEWYFTHQTLLEDSRIPTSEVESTPEEALISNEVRLIEQNVQESLTYINSPTREKYNFVSEDNVLIQGDVDTWVEAVYINDYKLTGFSLGDDVFFYRLLESFDSIAEGENTYTVYFESDWVKNAVEDFYYYYNPDSEELESFKSDFFTETVSVSSQAPAANNQNLPENRISTLSEAFVLNLNPKLYYNIEGKPRTLKVLYSESDSHIEATLKALEEQFADLGYGLETQGLSLGDITTGLRNESLSYDMMLIGINLWYFSSNIFPYFHSSQIENGYNISNYKKLSFDILLEELKSNNLSSDKRIELENKMLDIMQEESISYMLYTPYISLLIDKNIKNFSLPNYLPDTKHRSYPLRESYLSEKRVIQFEDKWLWWYIRFLFSEIFSSDS